MVRVAVAVTFSVAAAALPAAPAEAAERAPRTGEPPAGAGINTPAAYANPLCDKNAGAYGRLQFVTKAGYLGSICVAGWKGTDNGYASRLSCCRRVVDLHYRFTLVDGLIADLAIVP